MGRFANSGGARIYFRLEGRDDFPLLVFSHALGTDHGLWDAQAAALTARFQILRFDTRGHGASDAPAGDYTMRQLASDVLAVVDAAGRDRFAYCGLSLGGMVGQWLGAHHAERLTHLILANTSPRVADPPSFETRRRTVLERGMAAVADAALERFFSPATREQRAPVVDTIRHTLLATDPAGYAGCCAAVRDMDHTRILRGIRVPTLVIASDRDQSTPWTGNGEVLAAQIPGSAVRRLPTAHLSNLEDPTGFEAALVEFL
jgi:3-oxoadipate enol-lactonase